MSTKLKKRAGYYRISDIAKQVDRSTIAVARWEKNGFISKAKRDSRGWRIYTKDDIDKIVGMVKKRSIFQIEFMITEYQNLAQFSSLSLRKSP